MHVLFCIQLEAQRSGLPDPIQRFRRLYFDPGPYSVCRRAVELAVETFGADRLLFSSDYGPTPQLEPALERIRGSARLTAQDKHLIFRENAVKILSKKDIRVYPSAQD